MTEFTKGKLTIRHNLYIQNEKGNDIALMLVAYVSPREAKANARLIVKAPRMYALLKRLTSCMEPISVLQTAARELLEAIDEQD